MKRRCYDRYAVADKHVSEAIADSSTTNNIVFNSKFSKTHYNDGIKVGECDAYDMILPDEEGLKNFVKNYYHKIFDKEINDFIVGFKHAKRRIECNPNDPIIVDNENPIVIAYRNFFGKKKMNNRRR